MSPLTGAGAAWVRSPWVVGICVRDSIRSDTPPAAANASRGSLAAWTTSIECTYRITLHLNESAVNLTYR